jgi:hypothetical protein
MHLLNPIIFRYWRLKILFNKGHYKKAPHSCKIIYLLPWFTEISSSFEVKTNLLTNSEHVYLYWSFWSWLVAHMSLACLISLVIQVQVMHANSYVGGLAKLSCLVAHTNQTERVSLVSSMHRCYGNLLVDVRIPTVTIS